MRPDGLMSDLKSAAQAAGDLQSSTHLDLGVVADLDTLISQSRIELTNVVHDSQATLVALVTTLGEVDTALATSFNRLHEGTRTLDGRVKALRSKVQIEFDANQKAVADLLPKVQETLTMVEASVKQACHGLLTLAELDTQLVTAAETQANKSEELSRQLLQSVQSQRLALDQQSAALSGSWEALESSVDSQLTALNGSFDEASGAAKTALKTLVQEVGLGSTQTIAAVRTAMADEAAQELRALASTLQTRLDELKILGDKPGLLAEQDLAKLTTTLNGTLAPLKTINGIHAVAVSLDLFGFSAS